MRLKEYFHKKTSWTQEASGRLLPILEHEMAGMVLEAPRYSRDELTRNSGKTSSKTKSKASKMWTPNGGRDPWLGLYIQMVRGISSRD